MFWIIFILIWICSVVIHIVWVYYENKYAIFKVGDLIDKIEFFMWFPFINTFVLIMIVIILILITMANLLKLPVLWEKFRNIKLK
jgi:hypothetical protein